MLVSDEMISCKLGSHVFRNIVIYETGDVVGYVKVKWCVLCGVIHEDAYSEDGQFLAPYKSHVPTYEGQDAS